MKKKNNLYIYNMTQSVYIAFFNAMFKKGI